MEQECYQGYSDDEGYQYDFEREVAEFLPGLDIYSLVFSQVEAGVFCHLQLVTLEKVTFEIDWSVTEGLQIKSATGGSDKSHGE